MLQLAARLDRSRFEPMAVFTRDGPILDYARKLGVPAMVWEMGGDFMYGAHVPLRPRMLASYVINSQAARREAGALVRREGADLVHLNTSALISVAAGVQRVGVPIVWHVREVLGKNRLVRRWQTSRLLGHANRIIVTSRYAAKALSADARVEIVHNGVDLSCFNGDKADTRRSLRRQFGVPDSSFVVTLVGSVQRVKGHFLLVCAAKRIVTVHPDCRFVIVAGGVDPTYGRSWRGRTKRLVGQPLDGLDRMRQQVIEAGLERNFVFTGFREDVPAVLASSDAVVALSQKPEGFGRPLIEAMAAGKPVVATDIGPTREILGERCGLLVPPGSSDCVADAICRLIDEPLLRERMSLESTRRATRFAIPDHVSRISKIYEKALEPVPTQLTG